MGGLYDNWLVVVLLRVGGTPITDKLTDRLGVPLVTGTRGIFLGAILVVVVYLSVSRLDLIRT